jgi:hypothetical protein
MPPVGRMNLLEIATTVLGVTRSSTRPAVLLIGLGAR